jgi:RimJ/RimL family protein N-acetyltransferase
MDRPTLTGKVRLRDVSEGDLPIFFEHQREPDANRMAAVPARDRQAFMAHWSRIMADPAVLVQTILVDEKVAGNVASWESEGRRLVGYWIGRDWWGRGVASAGLAAFLERIPTRPLYARVAKHNRGSIRVLEKCGFALCTGLVEALPASSDGVEEWVFALEGHDQLPIVTRSLILRRFVLEDAAITLALSHEEPYRAWLSNQVYRDHAHARSALAFLIEQYSAPGHPRHGPYVLAVEHRAAGELIGHVGFSPLNDEVEIGFSIAQKHQRQWLATEAIVAATRWVFRTFELDRILAVTSIANVASKRAVLRAGFAHEEDKTMQFQGAEQEVSVYALSRSSFDTSRAR